MRRIAVIGNGGGGKSTLARALGQRLRIPVHEVDEVQWLPGWRRAPLDEVAIVYVDLPFRTHLWLSAKRQLFSLVQRRAWAGQSAPPPSLLLFRTLRRVQAMRADLLELVTKSGRAAKLVHLRSPREMARWLDEVARTTAGVVD
jgi:ATPase subunit of ABC transporter with duplicated ATPase domains